jgi:predicted dehydrogenase
MFSAVRPLRIVQVGGGLWGRSWAEVTRAAAGIRLAAFVDASRDVRAWAARFETPVFRTLEQALTAVEADAVLLVTPPQTHRPLAELALRRGVHVVSEKPLALGLADARALVSASERSRRHVMVAQNYRFRRHSRALEQLVSSAALGRLLGIQIACRRDLRDSFVSRGDWRSRMEHPYLVDMGIHHVDMLRQITGRDVAEVDARAWKVPDSPFFHEPAIAALITLDDGTPVSYEGSWAAARGPETSWNGDWELVGERGRATWTGGVRDALRGTVTLERYGSPPRRVPLPRLPALDRAGVLHELRRAVAAGDTPECAAADNLKSLAAVLAIARSTERGRPVKVTAGSGTRA